MPIAFHCPHCNAAIRVKSDLAGRSGKCPGCGQPVRIPAASVEAGKSKRVEQASRSIEASAELPDECPRFVVEELAPPPRLGPARRRKEVVQEVLASLSGTIPPVRRTIFYRLGVLLVAGAVVLLPVLYTALVAALGWGVYWHATENTSVAGAGVGRARVMAVLAYAAPIVAGTIGVLFMLKPLLIRSARQQGQVSLNRTGQPLLFEFVERICDAVHAPRPSRIDVDFSINAAAGYGGGVRSLLRSDLVLTIGLPLIAGLSLQQFSGVLAHEFGHFSQGAGMRISWIVRRVNGWFARVVYLRDEWDEWLTAVSQETDLRFSWIFYLARMAVGFSRGVLWCFMMVSHAVSCWLSRQMEFDADLHEARLAGSETFASTCFQLHWLNYSAAEFFKGRTAPPSTGNPIRDVIGYSRELGEIDERRVRRRMEQAKTGWLDTHPADSDRIEHVRRDQAPGLFHTDLPGEAVIRQFNQLCHALMRV